MDFASVAAAAAIAAVKDSQKCLLDGGNGTSNWFRCWRPLEVVGVGVVVTGGTDVAAAVVYDGQDFIYNVNIWVF